MVRTGPSVGSNRLAYFGRGSIVRAAVGLGDNYPFTVNLHVRIYKIEGES